MYRRILFWMLFLLLFSGSAMAQYRFRIDVAMEPGANKSMPVYLAGNFNGWNPADSAYQLKPTDGGYSITICPMAAGNYEFKFTRGSWDISEQGAGGSFMPNRSMLLSSDTVLVCTVAKWSEPGAVLPSTASERVKIADTAFFMPQLNRHRRITIYLPEGYEKKKRRYPVLYMHDGQNLFDAKSSLAGEWGIDECLDSMLAAGAPPAIVVGIYNSSYRMTEYSPYPFRGNTQMEGDAYLDFIVKELKPFIDKKYRTISGKESTMIAGSSLGALISFYGLLKYPEVFGNAGIFSPSFWIAMDELKQLVQSSADKLNGKIFFYMGAQEGDDDLEYMKTIADLAGEYSKAVIYRVIDPQGKHNETYWRKWFGEFYRWVSSDGLNAQVAIDE